jgi:hypothetical protein
MPLVAAALRLYRWGMISANSSIRSGLPQALLANAVLLIVTAGLTAGLTAGVAFVQGPFALAGVRGPAGATRQLQTSSPTVAPTVAVAGVETCDLLYSRRGAELLPAVACYGAELAAAATPELRLSLQERALIALSAVVNDSPKTQAEAQAIEQGLAWSRRLSEELPDSAQAAYWGAVFRSFDAIRKDRGSPLPRNLFGVIKSLQQDLRRAIGLDPKIHFWGPSRVLGLMHTQMPAIVGGDKSLAENLLRDAYQNAPALSLNHLAYARILRINGKATQAREVLLRFMALSDAELDPFVSEPFRTFKPEIERDREQARKLLGELDSDSLAER